MLINGFAPTLLATFVLHFTAAMPCVLDPDELDLKGNERKTASHR